MNTHIRQALETLDTAARQVAELFAKKYYECTLESEHIHNVGDDPIGVWNMGDEFWDFNDMVVALQHNADMDTLINWYYKMYAKENDDRTPYINLKSWLKGMRPKNFRPLLGGAKMTIQEFIDNAFTLHLIEDAKIYKNELVFVDIEDFVLAYIPLDITPKTDMSKVYINKTRLEPKDIEQFEKWLLEFSKTPFLERDTIRAYSETSEIDQALTDLIDDVIEFVYADYTDRQRTDEERQEAFSKLLWHKNITLRKLDKSSTHG